ncbi:MAG TPA: UbiA family prenyltransferase [Anaerolineales bacterium]|nr:UbiA family prenyltransferase [Anaerolineales bacterium]
MSSLATAANLLKEQYLPLIKSRQTLLLVFTGVAGYLCQPPAFIEWWIFASLVGSLLVTISGCTVLNMLFDRDIDLRMERTRQRPLADGRLKGNIAAWLGGGLLLFGLLWAALLSIPYFFVVLMGACLNVLIYTVWLKRRSAWSILWGGVAGGMPILAGHVLAIGQLDLLGLLLALVIVFWIPSHNLTLSLLYSADYRQAGVPTVLGTYGEVITYFVITLSSILVPFTFMLVFILIGLQAYFLGLFLFLGLLLVTLAIISWVRSSRKFLLALYKYSSLFLLISTILLVYSGLR